MGVISRPGILAQLMPSVPRIFDLTVEVIQLALQSGHGKPEFDDKGNLKNPVIDIDTLKWECNDIEDVFGDIMKMNLPFFSIIQSVQSALAI